MLILARKWNQEIVIGDAIKIKVVRMDGGKVWLGIDAPKDVPVHRREIYEAIKRKQADAGEEEAA